MSPHSMTSVLLTAAALVMLLLCSRYLLQGKAQPPLLTSTLTHHLPATATEVEETKALLRTSFPRLAALAQTAAATSQTMAAAVEELTQIVAVLPPGRQRQALRALNTLHFAGTPDDQQKKIIADKKRDMNVDSSSPVLSSPQASDHDTSAVKTKKNDREQASSTLVAVTEQPNAPRPPPPEKCSSSDCNFRGASAGVRSFCECNCEIGYCGFGCEIPCSKAPPPEMQRISVSNYGAAFPLLEMPAEGASIDAFEYVKEPVIYELSFNLDHTQASGLPVTITMPVAMRVRDRSLVGSADPYLHLLPHRSGRKEYVDTVARLRGMNTTISNVWRAPGDKCLFFISDHLSRFIGHYNPPFLTQLGKFLETFRDPASLSKFIIVIHDHSDLNRHVPGRYSPVQATVYWILRLLNLNVTLLPHYAPVLSNCALFTRDIGAPHALFTSHGDRLMQTLWTRVRELYKNYPTYKRIAIIKGKTQTVSPERGYLLTETFLKRLRENGFFLMTADTPMAERMWYVNHAERLLVTWGAVGEVIFPLRIVDREKLERNIVQLFHSVYRKHNELGDPPVIARVPGRYTEYARTFATKFPYNDRPLRVWEVEGDNLDLLTDNDLCCA